MTSQFLLPGAALAGVSTHALYLNRGEHHLYALRYVQLLLGSFVLTTFLYHKLQFTSQSEQPSWTLALTQSATVYTAYLAGVYTSLIVYRLFLSPMNKIPGPFLHRLGALAKSWKFRDGKGHEHIAALHARYGRVVRLGPDEVSVTHPEAVELVQGHKSKCTKGPPYDVLHPMVSLQTLRDKSLHAKRRRVWSHGFGDKAVRGYETRMRIYQDKLVAQLNVRAGQPVNMTDWFKFYSFDVMGDLAFGESLSMLDNARVHPVVELMDEAVKPLSLFPPIWAFRLVMAVPGVMHAWWVFIDFCRESLIKRMKSPPDIPDVMSAILEPVKGREPTPNEMDDLVADAQLITVAGGDTSATTLASIFYLLAKNPDHIDKLRKEIEPLVEGDEFPNGDTLLNLDHLNGVINEALRLFNPVATLMIRKAPPQGITIGGDYIPGDTNIYVPQYAIGRDPTIYSKPLEFIPERWYDDSRDLIKDKSGFAPFAAGPYGCIGKPLALVNLRTTIARIILTFDISFPYGDKEQGKSFERDAIDCFVFSAGALNLCLTPRAGVKA